MHFQTYILVRMSSKAKAMVSMCAQTSASVFSTISMNNWNVKPVRCHMRTNDVPNHSNFLAYAMCCEQTRTGSVSSCLCRRCLACRSLWGECVPHLTLLGTLQHGRLRGNGPTHPKNVRMPGVQISYQCDNRNVSTWRHVVHTLKALHPQRKHKQHKQHQRSIHPFIAQSISQPTNQSHIKAIAVVSWPPALQ